MTGLLDPNATLEVYLFLAFLLNDGAPYPNATLEVYLFLAFFLNDRAP